MRQILQMDNRHPTEIDASLRQIQHHLRYDIICQYRTVFHVYSLEWFSIHDIQQLTLPLHLHSRSPSFRDDVYTLVFERLLNQWMSDIHLMMVKIQDNNFFITN